jgi:RNA polymerase sigma-70 factor, ECF subfamily
MASDDTNLRTLIDGHLDAVYRYAYRLTGDVHDAEDLTQQAFLLAHERLEQLREPERARGWLFTILRNSFLKTVQRTQPVLATNLGLDLEAVPAEAQDGQVVDAAELQAAIDELPAEYRVVLAMFYFEDCAYREIAEKLALPIGTVMSRLARAKRHLRAKLFVTEPLQAKPASAHSK